MKIVLGEIEKCLVGIGANINDSLIIIIIFYLEDKERNLILKGFTFNFTSSSSTTTTTTNTTTTTTSKILLRLISENSTSPRTTRLGLSRI